MNGTKSYRFALFFREAWKNIRMAPMLSLVTVLTIALSLILVGLFGFVMANTERLLDGVAEDLRITVYLKDGLDNATIEARMSEIEAHDSVQHVYFVTKEEDRARNIALLTPELLEGLDEAAIPAQDAIEVTLKPRQRNKEDFAKISAWLEELRGVDEVQDLHFDAEKIRVLFAIRDLIEITGFIISIVVLAAAIFFTFSTIKLAVYARHDEIEILRLVGATDGFIRAPYFIEGVCAGLLGSVAALTIVSVLHARLTSFVEQEHFLNLDLDLMPSGMVVWILFGGVFLGLCGSALSVGRYLK